jgi:hypothetical protein
VQNVPNIVRDRLKAAPPAVDHPDANVLTAFAERALPDRERSVVLEHLSRCGDCRNIVALALPATEPVQVLATSSSRGWLSWPALRWGFVAAGIVAIASFGVMQYQRHLQPAITASVQKASAPVEVAANEPKSVTRFNVAPEDKKEKLQAPTTPLTDALDVKQSNENDANKAMPRDEQSRTRGAMLGRQLSHGPRLANQYPQQNNAQNQLYTPAQPPAFDRLQSFHEKASQTGSAPAAAPTPGAVALSDASNAAPAVAKAKPAMPLPSRADDATINQLEQSQAALMLRAQVAPGQVGGYVVDPSGAVVANARVTITPTPSKKGATATAVTNSQGAWLIAGLPTGNYKAQAEAPGFKATVLDLNYDANLPSLYSFTLSPGSVSETVEVSAQTAQAQAMTYSSAGQAGLAGGNLARLAAVSPALLPRWSINATGALQRSFDQGNTWQTVDVTASPASVTSTSSLEIVAKSSRAKEKEKDSAGARKRDVASLVFRAVAANGSDVWAGGSAGVLYHSADAGNTWTRVFPIASGATLTGDIVSLEFPEPQHGKLSTSGSEVWTTSDAGQSWQKQ